MKLYGITSEDSFKEFVETDFQLEHEESVLEDWLANNPHSIIEDGKLLIIGRQITTNLGSFIDLLAVDRQGDVIVIELKRDRTPRETLAQALEYASFVEMLDYNQLETIFRTYTSEEASSLAQHHRDYFGLSADEATAFNKDQRIVIVGQSITPGIHQTATYLRQKGLRVTCVEFTFFGTDDGLRLMSSDIVVGKELSRTGPISSGTQRRVGEQQFLASLDECGRRVFSRFLELAKSRSFPVHWGMKGFSLNVDLDGTHVAVCFGYPPQSVYKQSLYSARGGAGGFLSKVDMPEEVAQSLFAEAQATGLFQPAGRALKCLIERPFSEQEIQTLVSWYCKVAQLIQEHGLRRQ